MSIGKLKQFNTREFSRILNKNGFKFDRQKGSHLIYKRDNETITINNDKYCFNAMIARRLIKTYNLQV